MGQSDSTECESREAWTCERLRGWDFWRQSYSWEQWAGSPPGRWAPLDKTQSVQARGQAQPALQRGSRGPGRPHTPTRVPLCHLPLGPRLFSRPQHAYFVLRVEGKGAACALIVAPFSIVPPCIPSAQNLWVKAERDTLFCWGVIGMA